MYNQFTSLEIIEEKIRSIEFPDKPKELYEPIRYILDLGGKRIRPVLTLMAHNLFSDDLDAAIDAATGIEIFHNFSLLHDDIMDKASKRRGKMTVHKKWNENIAILSGDAMLILAYEYINKSRSENNAEIFNIFNQTAREVCEGQQMDMNFEGLEIVSIKEYIEMIRLKTSVLIAAALKIGAITGGAGNTDQELLYNFGMNIGIGFQLQDDFLDTYADSEKFGKSIGGDIVQNKKTFLLISALNHKNAKLVKDLKNLLLLPEKENDRKVREVIAIYNEMEIPTLAKNSIDKYFDIGLQNLERVGVSEEKKLNLKKAVEKLINRQY